MFNVGVHGKRALLGGSVFAKSIPLTTVLQANDSTVGFLPHSFQLF